MIPLAVRSHYSLLWGVASPERLCQGAAALGYQRLALTDTDNLYGLWPFLAACQRAGLRPIIGAEVTDPRAVGTRRAVCLVEDAAGFENLCRLLTRRQRDAAFDLAADLPPLAKGLVVLTGTPELLETWREHEVTVAGALPRRSRAALALRRAARRCGVPLVAVPGSFFLEATEHRVHRVLRAIDLRTTLLRLPPGAAAPADADLASAAVYAARFAQDPEALVAAAALAERCAFVGPRCDPVLPPWDDPRGRPAAAVLREAAYAGARRRYGDDLPEAAVERLEHELALIEAKGFSSYFLVVQRIVQRSPRTCGRGSGAASLVAYCLGITNVCPLKHRLYFERFLNPGRTDPPDIDVDFAWDERDEVLRWVLSAYAGRAAMVCNHVYFRPRLALREVAAVYGMPGPEVAAVLRRLPRVWRELYSHAEASVHTLELRDAALPRLEAPWPEILELTGQVVGTPRHLSVHVGGVVITPQPLDSYAPLQDAPKGVPVVQWEKDGTEERGLVKIDLLGNRSLAVIRDALADLERNGGDAGRPPLREERWEPEDDPATQRAVAGGETMGCFYIESPAMRLLQRRTGRGDFEHLVIHSSIIRPAANEFIREYVRRLRGGDWAPIHPLLTDVLDETYGILVYQEDVSRSAVALAGFSHAEADGLRKILTKKDRVHHLDGFRRRFAAGARARGVSDAQIDAVWRMMTSFEGYSFCKPHSASYARVSFQAAYLKVHHPAEFMAAVIQNGGGFYSAFAYVSEARRMGLTVRPPSVNASRVGWRGRGRGLRVGLQSIRALSAGTARRIVDGRDGQGRYGGLEELLDRARPDEEEARALILSGACDDLPGADGRAALRWSLLRWRDQTRARTRNRTRSRSAAGAPRGQSGDLFARGAEEAAAAPELPPDQERQRLRREFETLGFLCDRHPLTLFADQFAGLDLVSARDLPAHAGRRVRCAGWLITAKVVPTRRGEPMEFITFEDETGTLEATFFPRAHARFSDSLDHNRPYLLWGVVEEEFGAVTLTVDHVRRLKGGGGKVEKVAPSPLARRFGGR
jgi:DNA-directed DNA polymerase III PolC